MKFFLLLAGLTGISIATGQDKDFEKYDTGIKNFWDDDPIVPRYDEEWNSKYSGKNYGKTLQGQLDS